MDNFLKGIKPCVGLDEKTEQYVKIKMTEAETGKQQRKQRRAERKAKRQLKKQQKEAGKNAQ